MRRVRNILFFAVVGIGAIVVFFASEQGQPSPFAGPLSTPTLPFKEVGYVGVVQVLGPEALMIQTLDRQLVTFQLGGSVAPIKIGDKVAIWANDYPSDVGIDVLILTKIQLVPTSPTRIHYVGTIDSNQNDTLVVTGLKGEKTSFRVDLTLERLPQGYTPAVGDKVTVVAKPDPLTGRGWLAVAVAKQ